MPMNRSPCLHLLSLGLLCDPLPHLVVPPGMTALQESRTEPPPRPTPEALRESGVHAHQVDRNVSLHEAPLRLSGVQVIGRETVGTGDDQRELVKFRADIAICDIINLNYRFYPRSAYEAAIARATPWMEQGKLTGLLEHPGWDDGWKGRLDAVAARWTALGIEEKDVEFPPDSGIRVRKPVVWGEGVYTRTASGELIQTLNEDGVFVGISTNGYSSVEWVPFGELGIPDPSGMIDPELEIPVTGDDLAFLTIDFVALPANSGGQVYAESGGYGPPPQRAPAAPTPTPTPTPITPPTPPVPVPGKESYMHPKIKALLERFGKTLEQVKTDHPAEYLIALEEAARDGHANQEAATQLATAQSQLVTAQTQLAQTQAALRLSEGNRVTESRTAMVDAALNAAALPKLPPLEVGGETVDLNAKFREGLVAAAIAADSDEAATALLTQQIAIRAHELAGEGVNGVLPPRTPTQGPKLPIGDNGATPPLEFSQESAASLTANPYILRMRG
ncbi:hypothetical protein [Deinococcus sp. Leaf326]|uniref:hypothetical protein n=1 Tax=Deinococcus sp. Leaf326 TaxID=1736338 RepID=UPI0006F6D414|nr:hypothetical protein [Deinococcus sp. Leaf326]KQR37736.1 hypothetical protein ASF71_14745 [Deinococcus sp. Leaf326]